MEVADMRRLLNESKSSGKPLGCAVGMSKDMKTALLLLHKMHQGPEVGRDLKKEAPDIVNMRFGTARIDDENPKLVRLVLNRPVTGVAKKLVKTLKGTGYTKVKLGLEDGTEFEGADDEEEAQAQAQAKAGQAAQPAAEAGKPAQPGQAAETPAAPAEAAAPPPPPPPPQEAAPPDAEALKKALAALAARIPAVAAGDAGKTAALVKLAREGQVNIATNNLKYAATSVEQLRRAIDAADAGGAAPGAPPPAPPPPQEAAKPDAGALKKQLEALAKRIPEAAAGDAAKTAALVKLARDGQVNIATNNLTYAATSIEQLRVAIEGKAAAAPPAPAPADAEKTLNFVRRLKLLIGKAANGDAALEAQWMAMAEAAEGQLSGGDVAAGSAGVEALRLAMLPAMTRMQDEAKAAGAYTSSGKKWLDMRQTVEDEMEKLRLSIAGAYQDDPALPAIEQAFRAKTAPVLRSLDASLATKLEAAGKAAKPEERQKLVDEAHGILDRYTAYAADPLLKDLDDNPFVPLSLQARLTATLTELAGAIH